MRITEKTFQEVLDQLEGKPDDERDPIVWGLVEEVVALRGEVKELQERAETAERDLSRRDRWRDIAETWRERATRAEETLRALSVLTEE